jgi:hypothetical protein
MRLDDSWKSTEVQKKGYGCENSLVVAETNADLAGNVWCSYSADEAPTGHKTCYSHNNPGFTSDDLNPENKNKLVLKGSYI